MKQKCHKIDGNMIYVSQIRTVKWRVACALYSYDNFVKISQR